MKYADSFLFCNYLNINRIFRVVDLINFFSLVPSFILSRLVTCFFIIHKRNQHQQNQQQQR